MRKTWLLVIGLFLTMFASSQSVVEFFTTVNEPFVVYVNGNLFSSVAKTRVTINNVEKSNSAFKIVFNSKKYKPLYRNIKILKNKKVTYELVRTKQDKWVVNQYSVVTLKPSKKSNSGSTKIKVGGNKASSTIKIGKGKKSYSASAKIKVGHKTKKPTKKTKVYQPREVEFFTTVEEPFVVFVNGKLYSSVAKTRVLIKNIKGNNNSVKIAFKSKRYSPLHKNIKTIPYKKVTYQLVRTKQNTWVVKQYSIVPLKKEEKVPELSNQASAKIKVGNKTKKPIKKTKVYQPREVEFFTTVEEPFVVFVNGKLHSSVAKTRVLIKNITGNNNSVKIAFKSKRYSPLHKNIKTIPYKKVTYQLVRTKQNTWVVKQYSIVPLKKEEKVPELSNQGSTKIKVGNKTKKPTKKTKVYQPREVEFFTTVEEPFVVFVNGKLHSSVAKTRVLIKNITGNNNSVKIAFKSKRYSPLHKNIKTIPYKKVTYQLIRTKQNTWVVKQYSVIPLSQVKMGSGNGKNSSSAQLKITIDTKEESQNNDTKVSKSNDDDVQVLPCMIKSSELYSVIVSIKAKSFEDSKLTYAKQVADNYCLTAMQIKKIMKCFLDDDARLSFAKYSYTKCANKKKYYLVNDAFEDETNIKKLDKFLKSRSF